ncbi:MAG: hypothetical protein QOG68_1698, partial [Solirubrobacteraceae bacterium]|nr:hypothetical protein [Solirubrobacteraceae bacterium]
MLRTALALAGVLAAVASAAAAAAPRVQVMVVGRSQLLLAPRTVTARAVVVRASKKRCTAGAATPLAALAATSLSLRIRDYGGSCSRRAADGGALFVTQIGPDRNRGRSGWTYKVGTRAGSAGAADPSGPFGHGRLGADARITWFWCRLGSTETCQRTLAVSSRSRVARGAQLKVRVRGYDDFGHAKRIAGALVSFGSAQAITGP